MRRTESWTKTLPRLSAALLGALLALPAAAESFLWRMQGDTNQVYLLGSVHFLRPSDYPLPGPVERAYSRSGKIVFETDIAALRAPDFAQEALRRSVLPPGETLRGQLPEKMYGRLQEATAEVAMPVEAFEKLKPAVVAVSLTVPYLARMGVEAEWGVDSYLHRRAPGDGKAIGFLESPEFQLSLLTDLPIAVQVQLLRQALEELKTLEANLQRMVEGWREGDVAGLGSLLREGFQGYPELEQEILSERNRRWVPQLEELAREDRDVLVVVGAGHLVGYDGVIELLRILGHRVEQL